MRNPRLAGCPSRRRVLAAILALGALAANLPAAANAPLPTVRPLVTMDVYDRNDGTALSVYTKDGRRYVVGTPGHEYAVRIRNCTGERIVAVASVDGINVVSGETASPNQTGYVIEPWGSVEIAGWRKSLDRTAAFYFTDLGDSYAARTGRPANVGVIGVAVFREKVPPVAYRPFRDRLASADAAHERKDTPAAPAAAADAASVPRQEQAAEAAAVGKAMSPLAAPLGTGHGRNETSYVQQVAFERATVSPAEVQTIQYDRRDNLIAMGVLPTPRYAQRSQPQAFPGLRFAPDPR
jgi:hypothetical protein